VSSFFSKVPLREGCDTSGFDGRLTDCGSNCYLKSVTEFFFLFILAFSLLPLAKMACWVFSLLFLVLPSLLDS